MGSSKADVAQKACVCAVNATSGAVFHLCRQRTRLRLFRIQNDEPDANSQGKSDGLDLGLGPLDGPAVEMFVLDDVLTHQVSRARSRSGEDRLGDG